jgi:hypothetical protein
MVNIDVPYVPQRGSADCVIACALMLLQWGKDTYDDFVEFKYGELETIIGVGKDGSRLCDVEKLNHEKRITRHRWKPRFHCGPATSMQSLWDELQDGRPLIAFLLVEKPDGRMKHAVVLTGHSRDKTEVTYLDPLNESPVTENTGAFLEKWESLYRYCVHLDITEEYVLTDFMEE